MAMRCRTRCPMSDRASAEASHLQGATATYTPPAGATNVTDRFVYVVTDGRGGVSAEVISIRIGG